MVVLEKYAIIKETQIKE